ncbi:MAG: DUF1385 domain-containing protein [Myxococcota bacterium]|nr:DUF1385 domain-containing protein [Myxococcota bacterium]MDW8363490.1 DUF1385 domain-containing protein [Myxococcales bacterium]
MRQERPYIGGQAVIEGVMMRSRGGMSVAVRRPDGSIAVLDEPIQSRLGTGMARVPGVRGVLTLVEALTLGMRALRFSAEQQEAAASSRRDGSGSALALSLVLFVALFVALPQLLTNWTASLLGVRLELDDWRFHASTGGYKLLLFVLYVVAIGRIPEIRRVFEYHGAEHKTIAAYEAGLPLDVAHVRALPILHPRCGTTFLVVVIAVSIVLGSVAVPLLLPGASGLGGQLSVLALRIALLPLIAAVAYEVQRLTARHCTKGPARLLLWPGFAVQRLTTREPDDAQIEVAIVAMETARLREEAGAQAPARQEPFVFESFDAFRHTLARLRERSAPAPPVLADAAE